MKTNWQVNKVKDCLEKVLSRGSVLSSQNLNAGKFPIIDQGQNFIAGYTNNESLVFKDCLPVIVFGDHTRALKYVDFPFAVGADGTKILKPIKEFDPKFFYYILQTKDLGNRGYARYFKLLKESEIPLPPLKTQKEIVAKLDKKLAKLMEVKRFREKALTDTEKILSQTLRKIFEEGKKKGWEEKTIGEIALQIKSGFACGKQNEVSDGIVHLRTHNISLDGQLNLDKVVRIPKSFVDTRVFHLMKDDIIFNNTNSVELVGKTILITEDLPYAFSNHLTRIRFDKKQVLPSWVLYVFQKYWADKVFERMCTRWIGQAGINQTILSKLSIVVPPITEQKKIVVRLDTLSEKVRQMVELQKSQLADLKKLEKAYLNEAFNGELV